MEITKIIEETINGNSTAIKQLYDVFANEMYSSSYRITNDRQASQDIIQESFLKSVEKLSLLEKKQNYKAWYRKIVVNASLAYIKKRISFDGIIDKYNPEEEEENWYSNIPISAIKDAIQDLPSKSRTVFTLYVLEDYKHSEISEELGISISTSKTQYRYAKKLLRTYLTKIYAQ